MEIVGIYKINSPSEKVYIGQSEDIEARWNDYINLRNCKNQRRLLNSFIYYGVENHTFEIIKECEPEELNYYERHYQEYYDVIGEYGLNCVLTNVGDKKKVFSDETRKKQSEAQTGRKHSDEHRRKNSEANKGKKLSEEHIRKVAEANKGKKRSEDTRKKNSEARKGKKASEETRKKMSEARKGDNHIMFGKNQSEETKQKMSETIKKKYESGYMNPRSKKVINTETNEIYNTAKEMCEILGLNYSTMRCKLNGSRENKTPFRYL
jgi:group I intron endonuclease